jgi:hypothetical protein
MTITAQAMRRAKLNRFHVLRAKPVNTETDHRQDTYAIAKSLISQYGEQAISHATHQALKARRSGHEQEAEAWRWIAGAITAVLQADPDQD